MIKNIKKYLNDKKIKKKIIFIKNKIIKYNYLNEKNKIIF